MTQLHFFCVRGMTSSVMRMLNMKSIDMEARRGGEEDVDTCLMTAALIGHLDICRLLIDKGAQVKAKTKMAGLHFFLLLLRAILSLFASCVIMEQILRHELLLDGGLYILQPTWTTSLS